MRALFCLLLLISISTFAQDLNKPTATYAIVVGISKYETNLIPALQFADRDAQMFADYLQSKSGGSVPVSNIKLLQNEKASWGNIIDAMYQIQDSASQNSLVYFYFSGHGDVENKLFDNPGYLLGYNTPDHNYTNHAIQISFLNEWANTLTISNNCKVVIITDACHSGKLAGDTVQGRQWVGQQLAGDKAQRNLIRIASCKPNELSNEGKSWGDGRGVFSYYMLQGLYGLADADKNAIITEGELKDFLTNSMEKDPTLIAEKTPQDPVLVGNASTSLAEVDNVKLNEINKLQPKMLQFAAFAPLQKSSFEIQLDYFASVLAQVDIDSLFNTSSYYYYTYNPIPLSEIPKWFINSITEVEDGWNTQHHHDTLTMLVNSLNNPNAIKRFNQKFATIVSDIGQKAITAYLQGDLAELKKRDNYYNAKTTYSGYVKMYQVALKLCPKESELYHSLSVDGNYFAGLVQRLRFPTVPDHSKMLDSAFKCQYAALAIEPYQAAYLHNELGNLFVDKGLYDSALHHFTMACNISPTWAIPWINLVSLYNQKADLQLAHEAAIQAKRLQPGLDTASILMEDEGVTEELSKNWLRAEELQIRSIDQNKIHYFPYERLGYIYSSTARYRLADSLFNEADLRKKGFYFHQMSPVAAASEIDDFRPDFPIQCFVPVIADSVKDVYQLLIAANNNLSNKMDTAAAAHFFKNAELITDTLFLLNHYYGRLLYNKGRFIEAEQYLKKALVQFVDKKKFEAIIPALKNHVPAGMEESCFDKLLLQMQYNPFEDNYMLADLYEKLGQYEAAENCYRLMMAKDKSVQFAGSYQLLAALLIKTKHYEEAEKVWLNYRNEVANQDYSYKGTLRVGLKQLLYNGEEGNFQLEHFYETMLGLFPESSLWHNKASNYWYNKIIGNPGAYIYNEDQEKANNGLPEYESTIPDVGYDLLKIPGIEKKLHFENPIPHPFKKTLNVLQQTLEMAKSDEDLDLVRLNIMLGDLYRVAGEKLTAANYYSTAISLAKGDASIRTKLADNYLEGHFYSDAYNQLDTLANKGRLFTDRYLSYAEMAIHNGNYKKAEAMLAICKVQLLRKQDDVAELFGRLFFVQGNAAKAIPYYKDSIKQVMPTADRYYSIACLNALGNNKKEAFAWLSKALKNGFMYSFVLQNDLAWNKYKTDKDWLALVSNCQHKKYPARSANDDWKVE